MKSADPVVFEPVVQLREADAERQARRLVAPFVVSGRVLGLPKGRIVAPVKHEDAAERLQVEVASRGDEIVVAPARLQEGLVSWGKPVLSLAEQEACRRVRLCGGGPCTTQRLEAHLWRYVAELTKGKDPSMLRVIVE